MDSKNLRIILYSLQTDVVKDVIRHEGICFSKREYVLKKYFESANVFTTIYDFLVKEALNYIEKPDGAEYPYFAFKDLYNIEYNEDNIPLKLNVPLDECILFDVADYNKVLRFDYLTDNENDYKSFHKEIDLQGVTTFKIMTSNFYPMFKSKIIKSWENLFKKNDELKNGNYDIAKNGVEAFLWNIKKEWIVI